MLASQAMRLLLEQQLFLRTQLLQTSLHGASLSR